MLNLIVVTWPEKKDYKFFVRKILDEQLAACINVIEKVESFYYYDDQFFNEKELIFFIKSIHLKKDALINFIKENHPYKCPEILILDTDAVDSYKAWVFKNCSR